MITEKDFFNYIFLLSQNDEIRKESKENKSFWWEVEKRLMEKYY